MPDAPSAGAADSAPVEQGISLLLPPEAASARRRRRDRPVEVGLYVLIGLGAVCAASGTAIVLIAAEPVIALTFLGLGAVLIGIGMAVQRLIARDRHQAPEAAHAWEDGIELLLADGEIRAASWADPEFALDVMVRPGRGHKDAERLLLWRMDPMVPPGDLAPEGLDRLLDTTMSRGLRFVESRRGRATRETRLYEIRGPQEPPAVDPAAATPQTSRAAP